MVKKAKKKDDDNLPDNKWELAGFIINNWWKAVLVIIAIGIAVTGFSFKCGKNEIKKDPIYRYHKVEVKK